MSWSRFCSFLLRRRRLGTASFSASVSVVHFHANSVSSSPNFIPHSTRIPESYLKLQQLLSQNKSGFNNLDDALLLFRKMLRMRPLPCVFHFNQLLTALVKMKQYEVAVSIFREMCTLGIPVDIFTFNIAINCCCHSSRLDYAFSLLNTIIQVLCGFNRWEEVGLLLNQMIVDMNISPDVHTFTILVDAKHIIDIMDERGEYPNIVTYTTLMQAYCTQGQMDGALTVLDIIRSKEMMPSCVTYKILLDAYCKQMKLDIAMDLYRNMLCEGLEPTVETPNILLNGLCRLGKPREALTFFYKIQDQGHVLNIVTYRTMLDGLSKNQYVDKALSLFHLMKCNGVIPDRDTYNIIIRGCLRNKKYNEACELVEKMVDFGFLADAFTTSLLQQLLSKAQNPTLLAMHQKCLHSEHR